MAQSSSASSRSIGVLLHPTALPDSPVSGSFGSPTRKWLRLLAQCGIGVWQFLPLCPTDSTGSPYSSPSGFALNPFFLDAEDLVRDGFLSKADFVELPGAKKSNSSLHLSLAIERSSYLGRALRNTWTNQSSLIHADFENWCEAQEWLEDYVLFVELRNQFNGSPWWKWPNGFSQHDESLLTKWKVNYQSNLLEHRLLQWHLDRQWQLIRSLAKELGILLFGDMPFYVSRDSADVWGNRELFAINTLGKLDVQSGVPPDYFSATGQLWGTPVYSWENHLKNEFQWWRRRFARQWQQIDLLRLDHFRALVAYWAVPGNQETAQNGEWIVSPGEELLNLIKQDLNGHLPLIAEDLGVITEDVERLRDQFNLPGMKILQFAFDGNSENPYLPENINGDSWVVYSGTHDNPTTLSWWINLSDEIRDQICDKYSQNICSPSWRMIEIGMSTNARLFVATLQDILNLDDEARFNKPGTVEGNWIWRLKSIDETVIQLLSIYGETSMKWDRSFAAAKDLFNAD